jgi:hypothetical protein
MRSLRADQLAQFFEVAGDRLRVTRKTTIGLEMNAHDFASEAAEKRRQDQPPGAADAVQGDPQSPFGDHVG